MKNIFFFFLHAFYRKRENIHSAGGETKRIKSFARHPPTQFLFNEPFPYADAQLRTLSIAAPQTNKLLITRLWCICICICICICVQSVYADATLHTLSIAACSVVH